MSPTVANNKEFIKLLTEIVQTNMGNEKFGVKELIRESGTSDNNLRRKLKTITGQTPNQFINKIRLQTALELLQESDLTAAEVGYNVGFGSSAYFNNCFHNFYGYPPGEVKRRFSEQREELNKIESPENQTESAINYNSGIKKKRRWEMVFYIALIALIVIVLIGIGYTYFSPNKSLTTSSAYRKQEKSIIVLPFKNISEIPDNQYFADGVMEDILNLLSRISDLRVVSRTTSDKFRQGNRSIKEIGKAVRVNFILEGSVRRQESRVIVSVQLIDVRRDKHIWSRNFDRELTDIFAVQNEIALKIANELKATISTKEIKQIGKAPTNNKEAYDNYLKGRFLLNKANSEQRFDIDKDGLMASIQYFEKAVDADNNFALAYAGMANAWFNLSAWGWFQPYGEGIQKARDYSKKALEIDPDCAEAHTVKGAYLIWPERKFEEGRNEFLASLELNPNYPFAHQVYAQLLMITGPIEEARKHMDRTLELEPYFWVVQNLNAWIYYFEGKNREALEACRIARDLKPDYIFNNWLFFLNYAKLDEGSKAAAELQTIVSNYPDSEKYAQEIMDAYNRSGIPGLFIWLTEININKPIRASGMNGQPFYIAWWYAILGDKEKSIYWLEKNMETKGRLYTYFNLIATNPDFDILRNDPRFLKIIDETGLTPYNIRRPK